MARTAASKRKAVGQSVPLELGNKLIFWYTADSLTGLLDGDAIGSVNDLSGNNFTLSATTTARPTYKTNIQNRLPVMRFDGTANILAMAADNNYLDTLLTPTLTWFSVVKSNGLTAMSNQAIAGKFNGGAALQAGPIYDLRTVASNQYYDVLSMDAAGSTTRAYRGGTDPSNSFNVNVSSAVTPSGTFQSYLNGVAETMTSVATGTGTFAGNSAVLSVGGLYSASAATYFFSGDICEVGCFSGLLTSANLLKLTSYLSAKWGVSVTL